MEGHHVRGLFGRGRQEFRGDPTAVLGSGYRKVDWPLLERTQPFVFVSALDKLALFVYAVQAFPRAPSITRRVSNTADNARSGSPQTAGA